MIGDWLETNSPDLLIETRLPREIGVFSSLNRAVEIIAIGGEAAE